MSKDVLQEGRLQNKGVIPLPELHLGSRQIQFQNTLELIVFN